MKKLSLLFCCCLLSFLSFGQAPTNNLGIIPEPVKVTTKTGNFILPKIVVLEASSNPQLTPVIAYLKSKLSTAAGTAVAVKSVAPTASIKFVLN